MSDRDRLIAEAHAVLDKIEANVNAMVAAFKQQFPILAAEKEAYTSGTFICEAGHEVPNAGRCPHCGADEDGTCMGTTE